ncbi:MAG: cupin domain-containing protein [Gammaproteobacteria bacterium]|nr:cupin domain-containing protein [Gammaproteobacteria bacterium]
MSGILKPLLSNRDASDEQGSCGIRKRLLDGGEQRQFAVSQVVIKDARAHFHNKTWELYIVQKGQGILKLDGVAMEIKEGDVIEIPPKVVHQAIPQPEMTVLVVMSPYNAEKCDIEYL